MMLHYMATAKDSRTLQLPEEAQELELHPRAEIHVYVNWNGVEPIQDLTDEEQ